MDDIDRQRSVPGYFLAVSCPVPDVLVLLLHAVFDPDPTRARHATATWTGAGAESGAAVRDEVVRSYVGASSMLWGIPAGAKLLL